MLRIIAVLLIAIALSGCATQADKRLNRLSQLEDAITESHEKGNLTDAEYLRLLVNTNKARQEALAEKQRRQSNALMVFGAGLKNQQPVYQPVQMKPLNTGTSCISSPVGNTVYTDCY